VKKHILSCYGAVFTCIDCNTRFDTQTVHQHMACKSEAEKWHGKFANKKKQRTASSSNTVQEEKKTTTTTITATATTTQKYVPTTVLAPVSVSVPVPVPTPVSEPASDGKKRKRESIGGADLDPVEKKQKVENNNPNIHVVDLEKLKWRRVTKRCLKKNGGEKMEITLLRQQVVDELMIDIRKKAEEIFDRQIQTNKKVKIKQGRVSQKKRRGVSLSILP